MADEFIFQRIMETATPIFNEERGRRLKYMRMALKLDQKELGAKLGISQQQIAKLELGQLKVGRHPVPLAKFYAVFGCSTHHILFGLDADSYNYEEIRKAYWKEKDRTKGDRTSVRLPKSVRDRSASYRRNYVRKRMSF